MVSRARSAHRPLKAQIERPLTSQEQAKLLAKERSELKAELLLQLPPELPPELLLELPPEVRPKGRLAQRLPEASSWDPLLARVGYCPSICRLV